jgi:hypothetical protein
MKRFLGGRAALGASMALALGALLLWQTPAAAQSGDERPCLRDCRNGAEACREGIGTGAKKCHESCQKALRPALRDCRGATDPQGCIASAFETDFSCNETCSDEAKAERDACANGTDACLGACGATGVCLVGCHDTARACRGDAYEALDSCTAPCRDGLVAAAQACAGQSSGFAACIKQAWVGFHDCRMPCVDTYRSAMQACGATGKSCAQECLNPTPGSAG